MKTRTLILIGFLLLTGCSTNIQTKVEKSVKKYLVNNLMNPSTYKPMDFSKVDTITQSDTIKEYLILIDRLIEMEQEAQERAERMVEISLENLDTPNTTKRSNFTQDNHVIDSLQKVRNLLLEISLKPEVKNNIVRYKVIHKYSHKSLDNEMVDLNIDFTLDNRVTIIPYKISKGINGMANFKIKILCKDGGYYYTEFVIDPKLDGQLINSNGLTEFKLKMGSHFLTWTASNKNGFGVLTSPETFRKELVLEDSKLNYTYFVIFGKEFFEYTDENEAINDSFFKQFLNK
jgi:hypothetical protein